MNRLYIPLVLSCFITHIIRTTYEILKHKKLLKPDKISFMIILFNMLLLWTSWFLLCGLDPFTIDLPVVINIVGILLIAAGIFIFILALFTIKTLETYHGDLITHGIYSKIRHPMYLGFLLWLIGLPVYYGALYSFMIAIPFSVNVLFWRYLEEIELEKRFAGYEIYKKNTIF